MPAISTLNYLFYKCNLTSDYFIATYIRGSETTWWLSRNQNNQLLMKTLQIWFSLQWKKSLLVSLLCMEKIYFSIRLTISDMVSFFPKPKYLVLMCIMKLIRGTSRLSQTKWQTCRICSLRENCLLSWNRNNIANI